MTTFDDILPEIGKILAQKNLEQLGPIIINRDLNGRVRLILKETQRKSQQAVDIAAAIHDCLGTHVYGSPNQCLLFETDLEEVKQGTPHFLLEGFNDVTVVDRLLTETDWSNIADPSPGSPRIVFFSIKGGVGRSTALVAAAWSLAQTGKRVLVLDLDLESPGLSSSLLPDARRPTFGITDWLVEDLVNNGDVVFGDMVASSDLPSEGEILVVPAHGRKTGEYLVKLGRVWMPKIDDKGKHESWSLRLQRLLSKLETQHKPDVILVDSRSGIDEVASACVTELGANTVFLFTIDGDQTWTSYDILFQYWRQTGKASSIRDRLQMVGAMIPELNATEYFDGLNERAWNVFTKDLYDAISADNTLGNEFNFGRTDREAPHYPWPIRWHRGFAALQSLHSRFHDIDDDVTRAIFGEFLEGIHTLVDSEREQ